MRRPNPGCRPRTSTARAASARWRRSRASAPTILEGSAAAFNVTLSRASSTPVTVAYTTQDGTATASASSIGGADYSSRSGELTFQPGDPLTQTLTVPTGNDAVDEADESFALLLTGASNADLGSTVASTVIGDNDLAPRIVIRDASVREGNPYAGSPTKDITFVVTLSAVSAKQVSTTWATRNGSGVTAALGDAQSGDFVPGGGTLTIPPGSTRSAIVVTIRKDRARERDEHFFVLFPSSLTLDWATAQAAEESSTTTGSHLPNRIAGPGATEESVAVDPDHVLAEPFPKTPSARVHILPASTHTAQIK